MILRRASLVLIPFALLAASACGPAGGTAMPATPSATSPTTGATLAGRTFVSTAVTHAGAPRPLVAGTRIRIEFTPAGQLSAAPGCNNLSGAYRLDGEHLVVDNLGTTDMACMDGRMDQDTWFARLLTGRPVWQLRGDTLTLRGGDDVVTLVDRRVAEPDVALVGSRWTVDTVITGATAASVPAGLSARLTVAASGSFTVTTSCGQFTGQATVSATTLVITGLTGPRLPCPSTAAELNSAIYRTLTGTVAYQVVANRLTLTAADGSGLSATAS